MFVARSQTKQLQRVQPEYTVRRLVETVPEDKLFQWHYSLHTHDGFNKIMPEHDLPQRIRPPCTDDGLVETMSEVDTLQCRRSLHTRDSELKLHLKLKYWRDTGHRARGVDNMPGGQRLQGYRYLRNRYDLIGTTTEYPLPHQCQPSRTRDSSVETIPKGQLLPRRQPSRTGDSSVETAPECQLQRRWPPRTL